MVVGYGGPESALSSDLETITRIPAGVTRTGEWKNQAASGVISDMHFRRFFLVSLLSSAAASAFPDGLLDKPASWFKSDEGRRTTACVLSWQAPAGDWPKNQDNTRKPYDGDRGKLKGTFDNGATTDELRYLARAFTATGDAACGKAFLAGFDHVLTAQYPNGGWPQYFPLSKQYQPHFSPSCAPTVKSNFPAITTLRHPRSIKNQFFSK